ncbi:MAG: gliding motility-associated C-terminal domain-containing protein [Flavobacteriales bacterium]|nr:gliding motility-associated C-terminal domain-containing protein [Flavobacteriales bacterium]
MRLLLTLFSLFLVSTGGAQIVLGRQVIGSAAVNGSTSTISVNSNTGEARVGSPSGSTVSLTEGFEQPSDLTPLLVEYEISYAECWNGSNAFLIFTTLSGCGGNYDISITQNGVEQSQGSLGVGLYTLSITAGGGCTFEEEFEIALPGLGPCYLVAPNTITPNGDGVNDDWNIFWLAYEEYATNTVTIVNRWGVEVWNGSNYDNTNVVFNGTNFDGEELPEGVYYYNLDYGSGNINGHINLLR